MKNLSYPSQEYKLLKTLEPFLNFKKSKTYPIGIGDDAAIRKNSAGEKLIFTADTFVENVHFSLNYMTLEQVGYKAMVINLSDCAAMAALPDSALVQIVFPEHLNYSTLAGALKKIYTGFSEACIKWDFPIVGGNLSKGPCWIIDITLIGKARARDRVLLRKGIKNEDILWVTGRPGSSAAGLAALRKWKRPQKIPKQYLPLVQSHIKPVPRVEIARELAANPHVHAMIDISDGISKECHTLAFDNRVGITVQPNTAMLSKSMMDLGAALNTDSWDWFLHGGEDYELLFSASSKFDPGSLRTKQSQTISRIGVCSSSVKGVYFKRDNGILKKVTKNGWDHTK